MATIETEQKSALRLTVEKIIDAAVRGTHTYTPEALKNVLKTIRTKISSLKTIHDVKKFASNFVKNLRRSFPISAEQGSVLVAIILASIGFYYSQRVGENREDVHDIYDISIPCPTQVHNEKYEKWLHDDPINKIKSLTGPMGLTRMKFYGSRNCPTKIFYLFHDVHIFNHCKAFSQSTRIDHFMNDLINTSPYFIDFILETPEITPGQEGQIEENTYMNILRKKFIKCFTRQTRKQGECNLTSNTRFHFNDWRFNSKSFMSILTDFNIYNEIRFYEIDGMKVDGLKTKYNYVDSKLKIRELATELQPWFSKTTSQIDAYFRTEFRIAKQLDQCPTFVKNTIQKWISEKLDESESLGYISTLNRIGKVMEKDKTFDAKEKNWQIVQHSQEVAEILISLGMIYMDAYTVGRMFRSFKQRGREYHKDMRNVFVYTGAEHTANYINILTRLGCEKDFEVINPYVKTDFFSVTNVQQCIDLSNLGGWKLINTTDYNS